MLKMLTFMSLFVCSGSKVVAVTGLRWDNFHSFEMWLWKISFWKSGSFPYPYPSNQKRIETPLPLHGDVSVGVRGRNGIGPKFQNSNFLVSLKIAYTEGSLPKRQRLECTVL